MSVVSANSAGQDSQTAAGGGVQELGEDGKPKSSNPNEVNPFDKINPVKLIQEHFAKKKLEIEKRLLRREDVMNQDFERFLMEVEERHSWIAYELNNRNLLRMVQQEQAERIRKREMDRIEKETKALQKETGLSYQMGAITSYRRYQNSPAKFQDFKGHSGPVLSCKLSKCLQYALSSSADKTVRLWKMSTAKCLLMFMGHDKRVNDADFHPYFTFDNKEPCIISCSGDKTVRIWNSRVEKCLKVVRGHAEAIYRCQFSPDGRKFVTCSEDQTVRTWCFPDGYLVYTYKGHSSPVNCVSFSPSGKFIISASDYGERKLLLWDSSMPIIEDPIEIPHMLFWTLEGLIKKVIIRKIKPPDTFWLTQSQINLLGENVSVELWPGEMELVIESTGDTSSEESEADTDSSGEESGSEADRRRAVRKKRKEDPFGKDDVRILDGVAVSAIHVGAKGEQSEAKEYQPGGYLIISLSTIEKPIDEAVISIYPINSRFEIFDKTSGDRMGEFKPENQIPWKVSDANTINDPLGIRPPRRPALKYLSTTDNDKTLVFKEPEVINSRGEKLPHTAEFMSVYECPGPDLGHAIMVVNFRLRDEKEWKRLTYSMKESTTRLNRRDPKKKKAADGEEEIPAEKYNFDQEARHVSFWDQVREKNWLALESFFDKNAVLFFEEQRFNKRYKVLDHLEALFDLAPSMILIAPFIYKQGITRSMIMMENVPLQTFDSEYSGSDIGSSEGSESGSNSSSSSSDSSSSSSNSDGKNKSNMGGEDVDGEVGGAGVSDADKAVGSEDLAQGPGGEGEGEGEISAKVGGNNEEKVEKKDDDDDDSSLGTIPEENETDVNNELSNTINDTATSATTSAVAVAAGNNSSNSSSNSNELTNELSNELSNESLITGVAGGDVKKASPRLSTPSKKVAFIGTAASKEDGDQRPVSPVKEGSGGGGGGGGVVVDARRSSKGGEKVFETLDKDGVQSQSIHEADDNGELELTDEVLEAHKAAMALAKKGDDGSSFHRLKAGPLNLPSSVFNLEKFKSEDFESEVDVRASAEATSLMLLRDLRVHCYREMGSYSVSPAKIAEIENIGDVRAILEEFKAAQGNKPTLEQDFGIEAMLADPLLNWYHIANHKLLKSDLFGPDIVEFNMKLPEYFPKTAGQGASFLTTAIRNYGKYIRKMDQERLPTTMDEAMSPEEKFMTALKNNSRGELYDRFKAVASNKVKLFTVAENVYSSRRRGSFAILPGMCNHYPNEHYLDIALDLPYSYPHVPDNSKGSIGYLKKVFSRSGASGGAAGGDAKVSQTTNSTQEKIVPPVGRKPDPSKVNVFKLSRISAAELTPINTGRPGDEEDEEKIDQTTNTDKVDSQTSDDKAGLNSVSGVDVDPKSITSEKTLLGLSTGTKTTKEKKKKFFGGSTDENGIPHGVFLGRRGSFAIAPGLETFAALGADSDSARRAQMEKDKQEELEDPCRAQAVAIIDPNKTGGLLRRFYINGKEIGHHGAINCCLFSTSESRLVSGGGDRLLKVWDPRDGSFVRRLQGHEGEVTSAKYTEDELYLVSSGSDMEIICWDMTNFALLRRLRGHHDVITSISISHDCSFIVSSSYDHKLKSWFLTPRVPEPPDAPVILAKTDTTCLITWNLPPCFNTEPTGFHVQYRIGLRDKWIPKEPITVAPIFRNVIIKDLVSATPYQFQIRCINRMGCSKWSQPSKLTDTEYGIPLQVERPLICAATLNSLTIYFFVPNPAVFGAAAKLFTIEKSGEGYDFGHFPSVTVNMKEGLVLGAQYINFFRKRALEFKKWEKEFVFDSIHGQKMTLAHMDKNPNGFEVPRLTIEEAITRVDDFEVDGRGETTRHAPMLCVAYEMPGLYPGLYYRFRAKAVNKAGDGPWSEPSYSTTSRPKEPNAPHPPHLEASTLTSITFAWHAPECNGSAISGYRINLKHTGKEIDLSRDDYNFLVTSLQPGKTYQVRLLAKNEIGWSPYSEWSALDMSKTKVGKPEQPAFPKAVSGTYYSLTYDCTLPFHNGAVITHMVLQRRIIEPFAKGEWEFVKEYKMYEDVTVIENVDFETQQEELYKWAMSIANKNNEGKVYNPMDVKRKKGQGGKEVSAESLLEGQKPEGSKIQFVAENGLLQNTVYEFRVGFKNSAGVGKFSMASHRAKTNRAEIPNIIEKPQIVAQFPTSVIIEFNAPFEGGAYIFAYDVEIRCISESTTKMTRVDKGLGGPAIRAPIKNLTTGNSYQFKVRAENAMGCPEWSVWSEEIELEAEDANEKKEKEKDSKKVGGGASLAAQMQKKRDDAKAAGAAAGGGGSSVGSSSTSSSFSIPSPAGIANPQLATKAPSQPSIQLPPGQKF